MPFLKNAYDRLAEPFEDLIQKVRPDLILLEFAAYTISDIAAKLGVSTAFFSVYTAATVTYLGPPAELESGKRHSSPERISFPSTLAHKPDYTTRMAQKTHVHDESGLSSGQRLAKILEKCSFVVVRSCKEFESKYLNLVQELYQKAILPIGVLPPLPETNKSNMEINQSWLNASQWLDGQNPKSVLFVGFGSEYKMPIEQIHELAFSLELSRISFLWILRKPHGVDSSDLLPPGFANRSLSQGVVLLSWAPQTEILAHPAIGGCLFHSGWGTAIESLGRGHPLVLLPMVLDQGLTAKLLVEKGVGYEVPRNDNGSFSRDIVAQSIRRILIDEEGEQLRLKAAYMRNIFANHEGQDKYINKFIEHLENHAFKVRKQE